MLGTMDNAAHRPSIHLTPRDIQIILMVYHYDGLVSSIIKRRFWGHFGSPRPFYRRLAQLIDAGYLRAVQLPPAAGIGTGPRWITLGAASHPLLIETLGLTHTEILR